jgi:hypothetical protein
MYSLAKITKNTLIAIFLIILISCSKTDPITGEKVLIETDQQKKAKEFSAEKKNTDYLTLSCLSAYA